MLVNVYLVLHILVFWGYTVAWLGWPNELAGALGFRIDTPDALADVRAMYGGMCAGVCVVFAQALRDPACRRPAVALAVATAAGLLLSRLYSATDAMFGLPNFGFAATEVFSVAMGGWLLAGGTRVPARIAAA